MSRCSSKIVQYWILKLYTYIFFSFRWNTHRLPVFYHRHPLRLVWTFFREDTRGRGGGLCYNTPSLYVSVPILCASGNNQFFTKDIYNFGLHVSISCKNLISRESIFGIGYQFTTFHETLHVSGKSFLLNFSKPKYDLSYMRIPLRIQHAFFIRDIHMKKKIV